MGLGLEAVVEALLVTEGGQALLDAVKEGAQAALDAKHMAGFRDGRTTPP